MTATIARTDREGVPLAIGDRVHNVGLDDGVPAVYAGKGTVVGFGRVRIYVQWDLCGYDEQLSHHAPHPHSLRRIEASPAAVNVKTPDTLSRVTKPPMVMRSVRVPQKLWDAAKAKADEREENISDVVRAALERYVSGR